MLTQTSTLPKAKQILQDVKGKTLSVQERAGLALELAAILLTEAKQSQTIAELNQQDRLARMMQDPMGKVFITQLADQCFRSQNSQRVADQILFLFQKMGIPHFLTPKEQSQLKLFKFLGKSLASVTVPIIKHKIRQETSRVILPGERRALKRFIQKRRDEKVRVNLNHLGEAILGEQEAQKRLNIYLKDLADPDIDYISVKISTISSQINLLAWEDTLHIVCERLKTLYRAASQHLYTLPSGEKVPKFVNLDMEEYRDLYLTVAVFRRVLDDPEFHNYSAGIVLQSYIPESYSIQENLTLWAMQRVAKGGAPIKIRIVKGANLAMEQVDAAFHLWPQAPFTSKWEVDANFKAMLTYGMEPERAHAVHLGIGSHNIFDIAYALLLRSEKSAEEYIILEMLEGMADPLRRVVQEIAGDMLVYSPVAAKQDFAYAIAYLIRRLDENTAPGNFLRYAFELEPGTPEWENQANLFLEACQKMTLVDHHPRRTQNRSIPPLKHDTVSLFQNEPDTDWTLTQNRVWAEDIVKEWSQKELENIPKANLQQIDAALTIAKEAQTSWGATSFKQRSQMLAEVAQSLRHHRGDLIGVMMKETNKTAAEADIEVSEAIDFAEYYRRSLEEIAMLEDISWQPKGTILVTPPWNFPCSIPAGGICSALAAGNCVIVKPACEAIRVGALLVNYFWEAGISREVLQFLPCEDEPEGSALIQDSRVDSVVLTGSTATARLFLKMRPDLNLMAETGGKNSIIVTSLADRDLAIKDIVGSAFGHAGQKCSACSLVILEQEVYDDPRFLEALRDAAASLKVGPSWELSTKVPPLIGPPGPNLLRGLTTLDEGESWLLEPKQDPTYPNLWSPGIKLGVKEGSFTHQNEFFGPVLGVMKAENLQHAIQLANGTPYGLTAGIHSLDEREHAIWINRIKAGNCYINRTITGAIVQRQPFGGCKASSFGKGAKAGGPNYILQLMNPAQIKLPKEKESSSLPFKPLPEWSEEQRNIWEASVGSYAFYWNNYFSKLHDPSKVLGEDNFLKYMPHPKVTLRIQPDDTSLDVERVKAAAYICGTSLEISAFNQESDEKFCKRIEKGEIQHLRLLSKPSSSVMKALGDAGVNLHLGPVLASGRLELLNYLREVSLSYSYHRYGYLGAREASPGK